MDSRDQRYYEAIMIAFGSAPHYQPEQSEQQGQQEKQQGDQGKPGLHIQLQVSDEDIKLFQEAAKAASEAAKSLETMMQTTTEDTVKLSEFSQAYMELMKQANDNAPPVPPYQTYTIEQGRIVYDLPDKYFDGFTWRWK